MYQILTNTRANSRENRCSETMKAALVRSDQAESLATLAYYVVSKEHSAMVGWPVPFKSTVTLTQTAIRDTTTSVHGMVKDTVTAHVNS